MEGVGVYRDRLNGPFQTLNWRNGAPGTFHRDDLGEARTSTCWTSVKRLRGDGSGGQRGPDGMAVARQNSGSTAVAERDGRADIGAGHIRPPAERQGDPR